MKLPFLLTGLLLVQPLQVHAHVSPSTTGWNWDPIIVINLTCLVFLYSKGFQNIQKTNSDKVQISFLELGFFLLSILTLVMALLSPLVHWSEELQAWHMIQHMIIMMVSAPLFIKARPLYVCLWALPLPLRKKISPLTKWLYGWKSGWYFLWHPLILWPLYGLTLWIWHLPKLYQAALHFPWIHDLQHISFFLAACLFWRVLIDPIKRLRLNRGIGIIYVFATTLHATLLGVYMTLSPRVWYPYYVKKTHIWNLTTIEDQQLAGLIMWMPACTIYVFVMIYVFLKWLKESNFPMEESWKG